MPSSKPGTDSDYALSVRVVLRVSAAIVPIVILVAAIRATGVMDLEEVDQVRALIQRAGIWQIPLFIVVYGIGILAHVPGSVFVGGGVLLFGPVWGGVWCYLGALLGNLISFEIVRLMGYRPLARVSWPVLEGLFSRLAERPIRAVTLIRLVFPTTAPVNYALALTDVAFGAYLVGSLVGVLPQLLVCVWLFGFVFD
jgi:uncharacterized membrane protein YdjX (TVP38/TMEM64 family)